MCSSLSRVTYFHVLADLSSLLTMKKALDRIIMIIDVQNNTNALFVSRQYNGPHGDNMTGNNALRSTPYHFWGRVVHSVSLSGTMWTSDSPVSTSLPTPAGAAPTQAAFLPGWVMHLACQPLSGRLSDRNSLRPSACGQRDLRHSCPKTGHEKLARPEDTMVSPHDLPSVRQSLVVTRGQRGPVTVVSGTRQMSTGR